MIALMGDKKDKAIIRIAVSPEAKRVVEKWARDQDMTEIGVASRIYEWFGRQPEAIQRSILGLLGGFTGDVAELLLERWAVEARSVEAGLPDPAKVVREMSKQSHGQEHQSTNQGKPRRKKQGA